MEEVAYGLELSNVHFIWVVRFSKEEQVVSLEDVLPQGFLKRNIGEKGRIIECWAPQTTILKHPSIGAFLTHCGWNSTLEAIEFGVPIIALPIRGVFRISARWVHDFEKLYLKYTFDRFDFYFLI
ncbi:hypothetical protein MTR67_008436 [Solanum verrucosum]|uniref:Uncharacterized protein n=1 Tax=Solanum verrucosum TaxID=315347 RepID=A0AAF0TDL5_SOLVR|nr:hypothetical protein MTR67_008436 [Solanum verrucosum]